MITNHNPHGQGRALESEKMDIKHTNAMTMPRCSSSLVKKHNQHGTDNTAMCLLTLELQFEEAWTWLVYGSTFVLGTGRAFVRQFNRAGHWQGRVRFDRGKDRGNGGPSTPPLQIHGGVLDDQQQVQSRSSGWPHLDQASDADQQLEQLNVMQSEQPLAHLVSDMKSKNLKSFEIPSKDSRLKAKSGCSANRPKDLDLLVLVDMHDDERP
eukprot:Gb_07532 [translate_table: standard]